MRLIPAALIFLGSYLPLSLILLAQDFDYGFWGTPLCWSALNKISTCAIPLHHPAFALAIFGICLLSFAATLATLSLLKAKREIIVKEAKYVPAELVNYVLPYVVSFMSIDYQEVGKFVGLVIFLGWMFWITYRSGQIILNPLLIAFGWRYYEINYIFAADNAQRSAYVLANRPLEVGDRVRHVSFQDVMLVKDS